jgi:hypothetical protein
MTVAPPHQVRRGTVLTANLDDHSCAIRVFDVTSPHDQLITDLRFIIEPLPDEI